MHNKPITEQNHFTGHYINPIYGYLNIVTKKDHLIMTFEHHPNLNGKLECLGGKRFFCTYNDPTFGKKIISFEIKNDSVKSLKLRVADFVDLTEYEFVKQ